MLAGPFHTASLPLATRTLFWAVLIGINALKWWAWYRLLGPRVSPGLWPELALAGTGALLLNATLPLEIAWIYRAVGMDFAPGWFGLWLVAVVISLSISTVIAAIPQPPPAANAATAAEPPSLATPALRGLALKADPARILAITAEDHYLRLHMESGEKPLVLHRFGDALADLSGIDGLQVHRSAWVAARGVAGARREGRRWWLTLGDGTAIPVSGRHLPAVRARNWLERKPL